MVIVAAISDSRETAEAWWPVVVRIFAFVLGAVLITQQAASPDPPGPQEWAIVVGIGCIGPTVATTVASVVEAFRPPTKDS